MGSPSKFGGVFGVKPSNWGLKFPKESQKLGLGILILGPNPQILGPNPPPKKIPKKIQNQDLGPPQNFRPLKFGFFPIFSGFPPNFWAPFIFPYLFSRGGSPKFHGGGRGSVFWVILFLLHHFSFFKILIFHFLGGWNFHCFGGIRSVSLSFLLELFYLKYNYLKPEKFPFFCCFFLGIVLGGKRRILGGKNEILGEKKGKFGEGKREIWEEKK